MAEGGKPMELKDNVAKVPKQLSFMAEEDKPMELKDNIAEIAAFNPTEEKKRKDADDSAVKTESLSSMYGLHDLIEKKKKKLAAGDNFDNLADKTKSLTVLVKKSDWASLPTELLTLVVQNLFSPMDFICFRGVSKACSVATSRIKDENTAPKLQYLMLAEKEMDEEPRGFHNLSTGKVHRN